MLNGLGPALVSNLPVLAQLEIAIAFPINSLPGVAPTPPSLGAAAEKWAQNNHPRCLHRPPPPKRQVAGRTLKKRRESATDGQQPART
jgi:hypothetical protein